MAKVVIDVPDNDYQLTLTKLMLDYRGCKITVIPEGHGDLIDRSELVKVLETEIMYTEDTRRRATLNYVLCVLIGNVSTVIEGG